MSIHPEQHPLDGKLEPETKDCFNDRAPLYSIAISLKRIADAPSEAAARITELEGDLKAAFREISKLAREAGEATGRLAMSEAAGIVDGWRERAERAEARCRVLSSALLEIQTWRRECHQYDTDMGFSLRSFGDDDFAWIESRAAQALSLSGGGGREEKGSLPESPSASPAEPSGWRPMESAPRDRTYILARVAPRDGDDRWGYLSGRCFVIRHEERTPSGYDLGWSVFPGFGGVSDDWFEGWLPLPPTSEGGGA